MRETARARARNRVRPAMSARPARVMRTATGVVR
jgi:hypothetical protein